MRNDWNGATFAHPPGRRPVIGDLPRGADPTTPVQNLLTRTQDLGPIFEMRAFRQRFVFVQGAALTAELADESRFQKALSPGVEALRVLAGDGLFTAYSDEPSWRLAHDLLRPAFTRPAMQTYHDTMNAVADELEARWDAATAPVDVSGDLTRLTLETIGRTSFSHSFGSFATEEQDPFVTAMVGMLTYGQRLGAARVVPLGEKLLVPPRAKRQAAADTAAMNAVVDGIVADRVASGDTSRRDLLGLMLHAAHADSGERLDRVNIRYQILTFLIAGHETTSGALSFAMYYLARRPDVRRRAQEEADAILGAGTGRPTFEQVPRFRYIRRVLDETLRLWPTAPGYGRSPLEPTTFAGRRMDPDDWAFVVLPLLHRERGVWGEEPERFDPDHFLPERVKARPAHCYKPFGTGERACIGRQFALHEAVLVLARLMHRYDIDADPAYELRVTERLTLMPEGFRLAPRRRA